MNLSYRAFLYSSCYYHRDGVSPLEGRGGVSERVTLRWGPVALCLLDTFGSRLGASGHVLHNVPSLLSDQHWRDLATTFADDSLRALVVAR